MTPPQRAIEAGLSAFKVCRPVERIACQDLGMQQDDIIRQQLEAALTAALAVDGLCLVPKEPTQAMIDAGGVALATEFTDPWDALSEEEERVFGLEVGSFDEAGKRLTVFIEPAWTAMLAAANDGEDSPRQEKI